MAKISLWKMASLAVLWACALELMCLPLRAAEQKLTLPGTSTVLVLGTSQVEGQAQINPQLVNALMIWLSNKLKVQKIPKPPAIKFVSSQALGTLSKRTNHPFGDIVALYNDADQTIYLPQGWNGRTRAELSVLVHELVHHLQNVSSQAYDCPENREKLAYETQAEFLSMFGGSMSADFGIDAFTLLVRTGCFY